MKQNDVDSIVKWLGDEFAKRNKKVAVMGVSGGIDSAVVFKLCEKASIYTIPIYMPAVPVSTDGSYQRVELLVPVQHKLIPIWPIVDAFSSGDSRIEKDRIRKGNLCARTRMVILYDQAEFYNGLVVGTSNRTEIMLGYGTRWGDTVCDINPIGKVYKYEIKQLAEWLDVPQEIIDAVPSAGLWEGQTDEGELGITYSQADEYLCARNLSENLKGMLFSAERSFLKTNTQEIIQKIESLIQATAFKREPIPMWSPKCDA